MEYKLKKRKWGKKMNKKTRNLISMVLAFSLILVSYGFSFASKYVEDINPEYYDKYVFSFPSQDEIINSKGIRMMDVNMIDAILMEEKNKNVVEIQIKIENLNLEEQGFYGLEEFFLEELDSIKKDDVYLEDYTIYIPKLKNDVSIKLNDIYYGTYEGFRFMASFSVYNQSYRTENKDWRKIDTWVDGLVELSMNFVHEYISIPFSILGIAGNQVTIYNGAWIDTTTSEEVTSRLLLIQDLNMKYSPNPNSYVGVLNDQSKVVSIFTVLYPNSPYSPPKLTGTKGPEEVTSPYFYNRNRTMQNAFYYYLQSDGSGLYQDLVPRGSLRWR